MKMGFTSALAMAVVLGGSVALSGSALAYPDYGDYKVCYKVVEKKSGYDTGDRLVLNIKKHSDLTRDQNAYSVHGKYVDVEKKKTNMNVATGTVVTLWSRWEKGARLGLETAGGLYKTENHTFDCTNDDAKAAPDSWKRCKIDGGDVRYTLEKADRWDKTCDFFQNGNGDDD